MPVQSTPFLGRERELAELVGLASRDGVRLLTLTGAGGSGKTRLALQAAAMLADESPQGVWWVALAPLHDDRLVVEAAAQALGASVGLAEHVGDKRLLILFDNFEHVLGAAPALAELLTVCPNLRLLVTSREPLRLLGEQEYPVPPFVHQEGVGFFVARARAARPDFQPGGAVDEICQRLDDLPLALELAAVRVKSLSAEQILERLDQRLSLLTGGARDLPERQRTLRDTIAWSHDLLIEDEQTLFRRLSVFAGGWTLETAEAVCDAPLDMLASLVDKSLVRFHGERYWMLETIREYAAGQLEDSGEADGIRRRHAEHLLTVAESASLSIEGLIAGGRQRHDIVRAEQNDLRAALDWAEEADPVLGLRLAVALENFWVTNNPFEGVRRLKALLKPAGELPPELRARALRAQGGSTQITGDDERARALYTLSLGQYQALGDERGSGSSRIGWPLPTFRQILSGCANLRRRASRSTVGKATSRSGRPSVSPLSARLRIARDALRMQSNCSPKAPPSPRRLASPGGRSA